MTLYKRGVCMWRGYMRQEGVQGIHAAGRCTRVYKVYPSTREGLTCRIVCMRQEGISPSTRQVIQERGIQERGIDVGGYT
jgi:hypothetical protein